VFHFKKRSVCKTLLRGPENFVPLGRHAPLDEDSESTIVASLYCCISAFLLESFWRKKEVSPKELLQAVRTDYRANLIKG
jgi:hypothetical protein